jgi:hypothetical protein
MADLILAATSDGTPLPFSRDELLSCAARITPAIITPRPPIVLESEAVTAVVINPSAGLPVTSRGACLGALLTPSDGWDVTGTGRPDGSYVLCRFDDRRLELASDDYASRTLWYTQTGGLFLASTSQRALVCLLRSFEPDDHAASWMASSGLLGPDTSWDRRLPPLRQATLLTFERRTDKASSVSDPVPRVAGDRPDGEHRALLREAILDACRRLDVDLDSWLLPLSGGLDSRSILLGLLDTGRRPRTITWGLESALHDPRNDVAVAQRLARELGVPHEFVATDLSDTPAHDLLTTFIVAGEARTSDLAGYVDNFALWRTLFDRGVAGVIRGDCPDWWAGYPVPHTDTYYRREEHIRLIHDYPEGHAIRCLGLAPQPFPQAGVRRDGESSAAFDNRLYLSVGLPLSLAPLNDVKGRFLEVANPLLTRTIAKVTAQLPDHLKEDRSGFASIVNDWSPPVPLAERSGVAGAAAYLRSAPFIAELTRELSSPDAESICSRAGLDLLVRRVGSTGSDTARRRTRSVVRAAVPLALRRRLAPDPPLLLGPTQLAFRVYLASRMHSLLREDAAFLPPRTPQ